MSVLIPISPYIQKEPGRDSGVFLYAGQQILQGDIPYRDYWDHKPPLIFYINALGLLGDGKSRWCIWLLECLFLFCGSLLSFQLLNKFFNKNISFVVTLLWIFCLKWIIEGGNLTTEYAIPIQFGILYLYSCHRSTFIDDNSYQRLIYFSIGSLSSLLILLKPNLLSIPLAIIISLLLLSFFKYKQKIAYLKNILFYAYGIILPLLIVSIYFVINNAFSEFFDAVIIFNHIYSSISSITQKILSLYRGAILLSPLFIFAVLGVILWIGQINYNNFKFTKKNCFLMTIFISFLLELLLTSYSGRGYGHYYMSWIPILSIFTAYFLEIFIKMIYYFNKFFSNNILILSKKIIFFILICFIIAIFSYSFLKNVNLFNTFNAENEIVNYIQNNSNNTDYVLLWGAETKFNFLTERKSPTKFTYQYPLFMINYDNSKKIHQFIAEIKKNKPVLIIDTSTTNSLIPPINTTKRIQWIQMNTNFKNFFGTDSYSHELEEFFEYCHDNYYLKITTGQLKWEIYALR